MPERDRMDDEVSEIANNGTPFRPSSNFQYFFSLEKESCCDFIDELEFEEVLSSQSDSNSKHFVN